MPKSRFHAVFIPRAELATRTDHVVTREMQKLYRGVRLSIWNAHEVEAGRHLTFRIIGKDFAPLKTKDRAQPVQSLPKSARRRRKLIARALRKRPIFSNVVPATHQHTQAPDAEKAIHSNARPCDKPPLRYAEH